MPSMAHWYAEDMTTKDAPSTPSQNTSAVASPGITARSITVPMSRGTEASPRLWTTRPRVQAMSRRERPSRVSAVRSMSDVVTVEGAAVEVAAGGGGAGMVLTLGAGGRAWRTTVAVRRTVSARVLRMSRMSAGTEKVSSRGR